MMTGFKNPRSKILFLHVLFITFSHCTALDQSTGFTLKIIPWDSPNSPLYQPNLTQTQKFHIMALSSRARSNANYTTPFSNPITATPFSSAIQIPVNHQALLYSVNIKIGHPGKEVPLLLDTGSGPIWTHCTQLKFTYNPKKSKTYKALPCDHPLCRKANGCKCIKEQCVCSIKYGINNKHLHQIDAVLSSESFTLPLKNTSLRTFTDMIFGCSSQSPIFSGIMGMNKLPVSFISQVRNQVQGRFSYCLHGGESYLRFGNDIPKAGKDFKTTPLLLPNQPNLFLDLIDISVNQKRLGFSSGDFSYEKGGFLVDTGAQYSVLRIDAYKRVIQAFASYYNGRLKKVSGKMYHLDLCYEYNSSLLKSFASMTFHFRGPADYVATNMYVLSKNDGVMCVALVPGERLSILGSLQMWDTRFIVDINSNKVKFGNEDCSRDGKEFRVWNS